MEKREGKEKKVPERREGKERKSRMSQSVVVGDIFIIPSFPPRSVTGREGGGGKSCGGRGKKKEGREREWPAALPILTLSLYV